MGREACYASTVAGSKRSGQVRIISGEWRGRRLSVPDRRGLRPTGDRARETLFNWLQGRVAGRRVADLFAGSGALGLEAASRGAGHVDLVDLDSKLAAGLRSAIAEWPGSERVDVHGGDALDWLRQQDAPLDLVFVDPPFDSRLQGPVLDALARPGVLAVGAMVYVESARNDTDPAAGRTGWSVLRERTQGDVRLQLLERVEAVDPSPV